MKKVISFSVFGTDTKYLKGAIRNAHLAKEFFPEWQTSFYVAKSIPKQVLTELTKVADRVNLENEATDLGGMFWRFQEVAKLENSRVIVRDVDSRLSIRDAMAVEEWENSKKSLHIIRDHPMHNAPILGGLWGVIPQSLHEFGALLKEKKPVGYYGEDQEFLWKNVYKVLEKDRFIHDEFFFREMNKNIIKNKRSNFEFLGESFDEYERFDSARRGEIRHYQESLAARNYLRLKSLIMKNLGR
jgi:hypothetical protein